MKIDPNAPAFPSDELSQEYGGGINQQHSGLTVRAHFAGLAMQGLMASTADWELEDVCKASVKTADALIAELNK